MSKTIPQLTAATLPVDPTSLMEISIPGGGSRKMAINALAPITYTGSVLTFNTKAIPTGLEFGQLPNLTTLDVSIIELILGDLALRQLPALTAINFTSLKYLLKGVDLDTLVTLTTFTFPSLLQLGGGFSCNSSTALNQASVDGILVRLAALDGTGGSVSYDSKAVDLGGGTNAAPSATGLAAKATLEGRGNFVTVN